MVSRIVVALAASWAVLPAFAHHSFAMFDRSKEVSKDATVKELQWTNPHVWLQVFIADDKGKPQEWSLQAGAPGMLARNGWKSRTLKPGDKVAVVFNPMKNGKLVGDLVRVVLPDGRVLGPGGPPGPPPPK
jgi:hypothetical protein